MEVINIVSEALQQKVRNLLPSQRGFGTDLQAQNLIVPIIDLTETASGSVLRQDLQTAYDINSFHATIQAGTSTIASTPGFYQLSIACHFITSSASAVNGQIQITDGTTTKTLWQVFESVGVNELPGVTAPTDLTVFLRAGDSLTGTSSAANITIDVTSRQIATADGTLVNPAGFTAE